MANVVEVALTGGANIIAMLEHELQEPPRRKRLVPWKRPGTGAVRTLQTQHRPNRVPIGSLAPLS